MSSIKGLEVILRSADKYLAIIGAEVKETAREAIAEINKLTAEIDRLIDALDEAKERANKYREGQERAAAELCELRERVVARYGPQGEYDVVAVGLRAELDKYRAGFERLSKEKAQLLDRVAKMEEHLAPQPATVEMCSGPASAYLPPKQPIGIAPAWIVHPERIKALAEAIARYATVPPTPITVAAVESWALEIVALYDLCSREPKG